MPKPPPEWITTALAIVLLALASWLGTSFANRLEKVENDHSLFRVRLAVMVMSLCRIEHAVNHEPVSTCDDHTR